MKLYRFSVTIPFFLSFFLTPSPAFANAPIGWILIGANAPLSYGIFGFAAVVFIEIILFWRFFKISPIKAIILALTLNVVSTVVGIVMSFPNVLPSYILFYPFVAFYVVFMARKRGAPWSFIGLSIITIIVGGVSAVMNHVLLPPAIPIRIYIALVLPLFLGFGLTILIEGMVANRYFKYEKIWKGVLLANIFSYIFLILIVPFQPRNPYSHFDYAVEQHLERMVEDGRDKTEIILFFRHRRANNLYLLNLTDNHSPIERPYQPDRIELNFIKNNRESKPDIAQAIEKDIESIKNMKPPYAQYGVF